MCVCVCVFVCVCVCGVCVCIHSIPQSSNDSHSDMYVCIMYVCMYVCMYVHMYVCMYACMYVHIYVLYIHVTYYIPQSSNDSHGDVPKRTQPARCCARRSAGYYSDVHQKLNRVNRAIIEP